MQYLPASFTSHLQDNGEASYEDAALASSKVLKCCKELRTALAYAASAGTSARKVPGLPAALGYAHQGKEAGASCYDIIGLGGLFSLLYMLAVKATPNFSLLYWRLAILACKHESTCEGVTHAPKDAS